MIILNLEEVAVNLKEATVNLPGDHGLSEQQISDILTSSPTLVLDGKNNSCNPQDIGKLIASLDFRYANRLIDEKSTDEIIGYLKPLVCADFKLLKGSLAKHKPQDLAILLYRAGNLVYHYARPITAVPFFLRAAQLDRNNLDYVYMLASSLASATLFDDALRIINLYAVNIIASAVSKDITQSPNECSRIVIDSRFSELYGWIGRQKEKRQIP